ncbi:MAG: hypothetical protein KBT47_02460, partial [Armatimonadetes bacterium]|nr:hypothetical protein [Candidatus Hippobium faecium]
MNYEPWVWCELVGFQRTKPDYGVADYIENLGFVPTVLCLFVSAPDFILSFDKNDGEKVLPRDCCVYGVYSMDERRNIEPWKMREVKELISELHKNNIKVFVSVMTWYMFNRMRPEWLDNHKEILSQPIEGGTGHSINPLKRFKDGTWFEDFFLKQITDCMDYYNFDGWHAADGWGPTMYTIYDADFSDDFVSQFECYSNIQGIEKNCDGNKRKIQKRGKYIWRNYRKEWIDFYTNRWADFFRKFTKEFKKKRREIFVNSSMTRDPFEAKYRYGIDYRLLTDAGIDGFIVETGAAAQDLMSGDRNRHYDYTMSFLAIKTYCPTAKLIFLHVVQDHCENFDGITHNPNAVEKEVMALANEHIFKDGKYIRCADGFMVCLADGLKAWQWRNLKHIWDSAFGNGDEISGPMLIWSDRAFNNQTEDFITNRNWHTQKFMHRISQAGAPFSKMCSVDDIEDVQDTLVVFNSYLYPDDELEKILSKEKVIIIGREDKRLQKGDFELWDRTISEKPEIGETKPVRLWAKGIKSKTEYNIKPKKDKLPKDIMGIKEPHFFVHELKFASVSDDFIRACADFINDSIKVGKILWSGEVYGRENKRPGSQGDLWKKPWNVKVWAVKQKENVYRLIIKNDYFAYRECD